MRKITKIFVICAVVLAFGLIMGCEQPSNGGTDSASGSKDPLIGTWVLSSSSADVPDSGTAGSNAWYPKKVVFGLNGRGSGDICYSVAAYWMDRNNEPASWLSTNLTITIVPDDSAASPITFSYTLSGSTLILIPQAPGWDMPTFTFTKQ